MFEHLDVVGTSWGLARRPEVKSVRPTFKIGSRPRPPPGNRQNRHRLAEATMAASVSSSLPLTDVLGPPEPPRRAACVTRWSVVSRLCRAVSRYRDRVGTHICAAGGQGASHVPRGVAQRGEHDDHGDLVVRAPGTQHDHAGVGVTPAPRQLPCVDDRQDRDQTPSIRRQPQLSNP